MRTTILMTSMLAWGTSFATAAETAYPDRWVYAAHNLLVDKNIDNLLQLMERARAGGYTGIVLADYKFNILDRMPAKYFANVRRVHEAAAKAGLELIPTVFPIGYSSGLLAHDPNLAEGLPVVDAPFVVRDRVAVLEPSPAPGIVNGSLEEARGERFAGFHLQDDPGLTTFPDRSVVHGGAMSCRMQDAGKGSASGNCRLAQRVKVRPRACYRFSCWVKTENLQPTGAFRLLALGTGKGSPTLTFYEGHLKPTQDWMRLEVVFNSLDQSEVQLYAGQWSGRTGKLWIDDLRVEEVSLVNVLRRPGCPLVVADRTSNTSYEEGRDFHPVRDERLGQDPYAGEYSWRQHAPMLRLTENSRIKDGARLRVSWYHPVLIHGTQVCCCLSEPKVLELLEDQARRVHELFRPKTFFMAHDELRVAGWCRSCQATGKTPGELLADNASRCVQILKKLDPQARVVVWSDMFDPNHNAVEQYYLVKGPVTGSWQGLPPDVIIANWNSGKTATSLKWFADRGHRQVLAGYYDGDLSNFQRWDTAAKGIPGIQGFMYTTWQARYEHLEAYGAALGKRK